MKKPTRKLVLRRETIRTLTNVNLLRAVGGILSTSDDKSGCVVLAAVAATAACG